METKKVTIYRWIVNGKPIGRGKPATSILSSRVRHRIEVPKGERYNHEVHGIGTPETESVGAQ